MHLAREYFIHLWLSILILMGVPVTSQLCINLYEPFVTQRCYSHAILRTSSAILNV